MVRDVDDAPPDASHNVARQSSVLVRAMLDPRALTVAVEECRPQGERPAAHAWVVVDALGAGPAIVQALDDAGAGEVDVASVDVGGAQLDHVVRQLLQQSPGPIGVASQLQLACLANARPAMATLARTLGGGDTVGFACVGTADGATAVEDAWAVGVLVRLLLDELDVPLDMDDGAGIAISLTSTYDSAQAGLEAGATGRMLAATGRAGLIGAAVAGRDLAGCVPRLMLDAARDVVVAHA